jgi:iron complex transport system permease protein
MRAKTFLKKVQLCRFMVLQQSGKKVVVISLVGLSILFFANLAVGSTAIGVREIIGALVQSNDEATSSIIWFFRLPKAITCVLVGAALALSGLLMQTIFRNPLAGPDVLGLSSGASLSVAVVILASNALPWALGTPTVVALAATVGCAVIFLIMTAVVQRMQNAASLLIIGLMVSAATTSVVAILQYVSRAEDLQAFIIWTMGSVTGTNWNEIGVLMVFTIAGTTLAASQIKPLNSWVLGETYARSMGVGITRARILVMLATSLMTGAVTAFCGPISFVGLAVPHLVRLAAPTMQHRQLLPLVMIVGAALLLVCDLIAQLPGASQVLPLNAVTALLGAPVVIWVVVRSKKIAF